MEVKLKIKDHCVTYEVNRGKNSTNKYRNVDLKKYSQGKGMESVFHHPMKIIHFFFIGKIKPNKGILYSI